MYYDGQECWCVHTTNHTLLVAQMAKWQKGSECMDEGLNERLLMAESKRANSARYGKLASKYVLDINKMVSRNTINCFTIEIS